MHLLSRHASDLESTSVMNVKLDRLRLAVSALECSLLLHLPYDFVLGKAKGKDASVSVRREIA